MAARQAAGDRGSAAEEPASRTIRWSCRSPEAQRHDAASRWSGCSLLSLPCRRQRMNCVPPISTCGKPRRALFAVVWKVPARGRQRLQPRCASSGDMQPRRANPRAPSRGNAYFGARGWACRVGLQGTADRHRRAQRHLYRCPDPASPMPTAAVETPGSRRDAPFTGSRAPSRRSRWRAPISGSASITSCRDSTTSSSSSRCCSSSAMAGAGQGRHRLHGGPQHHAGRAALGLLQPAAGAGGGDHRPQHRLRRPRNRRGRAGRPRSVRADPWIMAFTFGLLHGFGFAGALKRWACRSPTCRWRS